MPEAEASGSSTADSIDEPRSRSARSVPEEPRKTIAELSAEMLRDFPITGNEGATRSDSLQSPQAGMFVNKGHGLKELDKVAPNKSSNWSVHILHIDSSREDVDYIQFDRVPNPTSNEEFFVEGIELISRGETNELDENNEIAFRAMRGEKVARPLPYPNGQELGSLDYKKRPKAFIRTEPLPSEDSDLLEKDRHQVYKGHGFLPGDTVATMVATDPPTLNIVDIIPSDDYDEVVLSSTPYYQEAFLLYHERPDDGSLSPDLLAKRNAYISKMQAS